MTVETKLERKVRNIIERNLIPYSTTASKREK
jgi:hypothetical protein